LGAKKDCQTNITPMLRAIAKKSRFCSMDLTCERARHLARFHSYGTGSYPPG
jgi:hypothetical protein